MEAHSLSMLISLAASARDAAAAQRVQAQRKLDASRAQLDQLHDYAKDYALRASEQLSRGCDVMAQSNARAFGGRLDEAIAAQLAEFEQREKQLLEADAQWRDLASRVRRLEMLAERREEAARESEKRRDQKMTDELARSAALRRTLIGTDK